MNTEEKKDAILNQLKNINMEQIDDNTADRQIEFLTECMEQNLEHARHVEDERMNFIQIHLVLVGGVLAFLSANALDKKSNVVLIILVAVTLLGGFVKKLLKRWDDVFAAHRACAMNCYIKIAEISELRESTSTEFPVNILKEVKRGIPEALRDQVPCYPFTFSESGKTGTLIKWFTNGLIIVTGVVAAGYFLQFWVMPLL